jgi:toxoflavin synthase
MAHRTYSEIAQEYDEIAHEYRDSKLLPFRDYAESFSLFRLIGKLDGKTVLDLACGEGHYTRRLKQAGADRVLGVDISPEMIKLAQDSEKITPLGCQYLVGNAATILLDEQFDVVVGVYLLNYASSKAMLLDLCGAIYNHLKPGGVFVGINASMTLDPAKYANYQKYGLMLLSPDHRVEGDLITFLITNPDGTRFQIDNFFLRPETYAAAFWDAGFRAFASGNLWVSDPGRQRFPDGYWDAMLTDPPIVSLRAEKSSEGTAAAA